MNRKSLRKKIVEVLKAANNPLFGQDVLEQRSVPTDIESLPVILIYSKSTSVDRFDESPKRYLESVDITMECITQHDDDSLLADELDDLAAAVEKIIEDNYYLEENCEFINLKSVMSDTEGDGQSPIGSMRLTYTFGIINEPRQDVVHADLNTLDNNWQMNDNLNNDAKDILTLEE